MKSKSKNITLVKSETREKKYNIINIETIEKLLKLKIPY